MKRAQKVLVRCPNCGNSRLIVPQGRLKRHCLACIEALNSQHLDGLKALHVPEKKP